MQRNAETCAHCGEFFIHVEKTPLINRTDCKTFHVNLFWGPIPRPNPSGGFFSEQIMCSFSYMHDQIGWQRRYLVVYIVDAKKTVEDAADHVAELVQAGQKLRGVYTLADGQLKPGRATQHLESRRFIRRPAEETTRAWNGATGRDSCSRSRAAEAAFIEGQEPRGSWSAHFYVDRVQRMISIGTVRDIPTKEQARQAFDRLASKIPGFRPAPPARMALMPSAPSCTSGRSWPCTSSRPAARDGVVHVAEWRKPSRCSGSRRTLST